MCTQTIRVNLCTICKQKGFQVTVCDNLSLPYRSNVFDVVLSIAVIHHFATSERRQLAIKELMRVTRVGGRVLIFVWALEQHGKREFSLEHQDVLVPWVVKSGEGERVYQRYYHLFKEGELEEMVRTAAQVHGLDLDIVQSGYDKDNWYCIIQRSSS